VFGDNVSCQQQQGKLDEAIYIHNFF
jgi:hypothetical protein